MEIDNETDNEIIEDIRYAMKHLAKIAGFDVDFFAIVHEISIYDEIEDEYKIIDRLKNETMFHADTLEGVLWNIQQMY